VSRHSDYLSAAFWAVLGAGITVASWRLDRLESLAINPWSVPGLTPGVVGVLMILLALALGLQTRHRPPDAAGPPGPAAGPQGAPEAGAEKPAGDVRRTLAAGTLCVLFAGLLLGRGLPFALLASTFVFLFTTAFSWPQWRAQGSLLRKLPLTLVISLLACFAIAWLFESVFLVRLP
jgi:hypothetical protein